LTTIQGRRATAADWTTANPVLALGESGYETDTRRQKIGDGTTAWTALLYVGGGGAANTTTDVTATGFDAASNNTATSVTATGLNAALNNSGANSTVTGINAARNNSGTHLAATGEQAAYFNTGNYVTATGSYAAQSNAGTNVTGTGSSAAHSNTGDNVTATGVYAGYANAGDNVTVAGYYAAQNNTGNHVTASGFSAAQNNTGANVTAFGSNAANANAHNDATAFGIGTGVAGANSTALGANAVGTAANQVMLGNAAVVEVRSAATFYGAGFVTVSDRTLKKDITAIPAAVAVAFSKRLGWFSFSRIANTADIDADYARRLKLWTAQDPRVGPEPQRITIDESNQTFAGVIAQDVEALVNELQWGSFLLERDANGILQVDILSLHAVVAAGLNHRLTNAGF
jgi:hypothetical protein